jgi:hypothetical protein
LHSSKVGEIHRLVMSDFAPVSALSGMLRVLTLCLLSYAIISRAEVQWQDAGFEIFASGEHAVSRVKTGWEAQKTGRSVIQDKLLVTGIKDATQAHTGEQCVALTIPEDTVGFEFVTVGQRLPLAANADYEASVWVRWPDGPDTAPAGASATSGHSSAIVSFWARHRDGTGDFAGRDEWLFDNQWHQLTFRFRATNPEQATLIYVSLLPNQKPAETRLLVDDFELKSTPSEITLDQRGTRLRDADFTKQKPGAVSPPWYFANIGGKGIRGENSADGFQMAMNRDTTNFESAQLWQHVVLLPGTRYDIKARIRWDNFHADAPAPIVN